MSVERWNTCEFTFDAQRPYSNPFRDVDLTATFVHETSGAEINVNGFYDGGSTWRLRFMPTQLGAWRYVTASPDPGLGGRTGSLECLPPEKAYLHGPITCKGYHFFHADGTPRFLISTRLSCQFASPLVWGKVIQFLKEHCINRVFFMLGGIHGMTKDLYGDGLDFDRFNLRRFQSIDAFIDALRQADILASPYFYYFNDGVQRGMTLEQDRAYIRYGMARFGAYANVMPVLSNEVEQKYTIRSLERVDKTYDPRSHPWANEVGAYLAGLSVFGAPVSVHNPLENYYATKPSFYTLLLDWPFPWAGYMLRQAQVGALGAASALSDDVPEQAEAVYNERAYALHNQLMIDLRRYGLPVINEEPGYELCGVVFDGGLVSAGPGFTQTAWRLLLTFWTAVTAGAYTIWGNPMTYEVNDPMPGLLDSVMPSRLKILHEIVTSLPYQEMEPANEIVSANEVTIDRSKSYATPSITMNELAIAKMAMSEAEAGAGYRTNFCLARPGEAYLIFSMRGGELTVDLAPGAAYEITQIDPRSGVREPRGKFNGGRRSIPVSGRDQVLICRRTG